MQALCHAVEAIVAPDWAALPAACVAALGSPRPDTRFWAAHELGRLRDPAVVPALARAARDEVAEVRAWAAAALGRARGSERYRADSFRAGKIMSSFVTFALSRAV